MNVWFHSNIRINAVTGLIDLAEYPPANFCLGALGRYKATELCLAASVMEKSTPVGQLSCKESVPWLSVLTGEAIPLAQKLNWEVLAYHT